MTRKAPAPDSASPDKVREAVVDVLKNGAPGISEAVREALARNVVMNLKARLASLPASPAEEEAPVAWRCRHADYAFGAWSLCIKKPTHLSDEWEVTPLYAAPPPPVAEAGDAGGEAVARVSADAINVLLSEEARIEDGRLDNGPYLAVRIASMIEASLQPVAAMVVNKHGEGMKLSWREGLDDPTHGDHDATHPAGAPHRTVPLCASPRPEAETASRADDREALLQALREATQQETSMAWRMRAAIVEARQRLAKGRALWNGPCHECDAVLAEALTVDCPVRHEHDPVSE